ncbi:MULTISPECIES: hypothetical protein [unclassified Burkholderia]|uniref:hypothetical protein n=1 Tax=unclassified Burkholderia TaxID=2613784 RepID=UPI001268A2D2|nr:MULTISPECIES: hypothetical protein [unclassified Burkholderia]NIE84614.1 hypothetical protein [Burkholderia sp. Tr-860]NIF63935.1 hypothetical protein [Burkholderia sp. Cy-647]NIF98894.1 hypothetical protein [Burkholderia sp. Ax-1720]
MSEQTDLVTRAADELDAGIRAFRHVGAIFDAIRRCASSGAANQSELMYLCEAGHEIAAQHSKRSIEASWALRHEEQPRFERAAPVERVDLSTVAT